MGTAIRAALALTGALLGFCLAGCGTVSGSPGAPSSPGSPPGSSPPGSTGGLRGTAVTRVDCASQMMQTEGTPRVLRQTPVEVVVCPLLLPSAGTRAVTLRPVPAQLLAALSLPDMPRPKAESYACPMYADVVRVVFARTADGSVYRLRIPVDACGHYLAAPLRLLEHFAPTHLTSPA